MSSGTNKERLTQNNGKISELINLLKTKDVPSGGTENKLAKVIDASITELTAEDWDGATKVKDYGFAYCKNLVSVVFPNSVKSVASAAFSNCNALTSITLNEGLTYIGAQAFYNCPLQKITIPSTVKTMLTRVFLNCNSLTEIHMKPLTPPALNGGAVLFSSTGTIYVPYGSLNAYKTETNWSTLDVDNGGTWTFVELNEDGTIPEEE